MSIAYVDTASTLPRWFERHYPDRIANVTAAHDAAFLEDARRDVDQLLA